MKRGKMIAFLIAGVLLVATAIFLFRFQLTSSEDAGHGKVWASNGRSSKEKMNFLGILAIGSIFGSVFCFIFSCIACCEDPKDDEEEYYAYQQQAYNGAPAPVYYQQQGASYAGAAPVYYQQPSGVYYQQPGVPAAPIVQGTGPVVVQQPTTQQTTTTTTLVQQG